MSADDRAERTPAGLACGENSDFKRAWLETIRPSGGMSIIITGHSCFDAFSNSANNAHNARATPVAQRSLPFRTTLLTLESLLDVHMDHRSGLIGNKQHRSGLPQSIPARVSAWSGKSLASSCIPLQRMAISKEPGRCHPPVDPVGKLGGMNKLDTGAGACCDNRCAMLV